MAKIIDAHHHLWRYDAKEYAWITPELRVLQTDFLPEDLDQAMETAEVDGSVVVQARQTMEETDWLLTLAEGSAAILGVVGWLPIESPELPSLLQRYAARTRLKGLRHVIQDEPDPGFILSDAFNQGITALQGTGFSYDILIYANQLPQTIEFVRRHPGQAFVLDHGGKPAIGGTSFAEWRRDLGLLANCPNVTCKVSGLATQVHGGDWNLEKLRPYLDATLEAFGPGRLMAGSDWPVCLLASTYPQWWAALREWAGCLNEADSADFFGGTAQRVYRLGRMH